MLYSKAQIMNYICKTITWKREIGVSILNNYINISKYLKQIKYK